MDSVLAFPGRDMAVNLGYREHEQGQLARYVKDDTIGDHAEPAAG
jgi:hypothetical protein